MPNEEFRNSSVFKQFQGRCCNIAPLMWSSARRMALGDTNAIWTKEARLLRARDCISKYCRLAGHRERRAGIWAVELRRDLALDNEEQ
jgi:hypothetical protein